jgi:hypothetical protein
VHALAAGGFYYRYSRGLLERWKGMEGGRGFDGTSPAKLIISEQVGGAATTCCGRQQQQRRRRRRQRGQSA